MDGPDWLRTQLTSFTCPACGRRYRGSKIRLLAERDGLFFVDLDCARCGSHTVAIVTVEIDDATASIRDISDLTLNTDELPEHFGEGLPAGAATVTPSRDGSPASIGTGRARRCRATAAGPRSATPTMSSDASWPRPRGSRTATVTAPRRGR